jgi:EAL domain-containing protein (putative c-di-GMP-specific phosphodiesterase class I)
MKKALQQLLLDRELEMAFQPVWDLREERVLGYEALARPAAHYGFTGPEQLFNVAHGSKMVHELDVLCFEAVVRSVKHIPADALLFVNVSPATLEHPEFDPRRLTYGISRRGFDPNRVVLEVTERAISDIERVVERALAFRELGVKLALDDAGAGNAGLWMLSILPVDYIKIDGSIVNRALADKTCRAVLAGIVAIAQETESVLVAEGIETEEVLQFISSYGAGPGNPTGKIRAVQGFLIARPAIAGSVDLNASALRNRLAASKLTA